MNPSSNSPDNIDLSKLDDILFRQGSHRTREAGMCVMEAVAWVAGEPHTDFPVCVPREVARLAQKVNDADFWDSAEQRTEALGPLIPLLLRASHAPEARTRRGYLAAHFAAQKAANALESAGVRDAAEKLRAVPLPTSLRECLALRRAAQEARNDADAAYAAYAFAADARAAAAYAAYAAADAAATDAADAAATEAAYAAAYAAAVDAAYAAPLTISSATIHGVKQSVRRESLIHLLRAFCEVM